MKGKPGTTTNRPRLSRPWPEPMGAWRRKKLYESRKDPFKSRETAKAERATIYAKYLYLRDNADMNKADAARRFGIPYRTLLNIVEEGNKGAYDNPDSAL